MLWRGVEGGTLKERVSGLGVSKVTALSGRGRWSRRGLFYRRYRMEQGKRGRPKHIYRQPKNLKKFAEEPRQGYGSTVTFHFSTLKGVCRHEKDGCAKFFHRSSKNGSSPHASTLGMVKANFNIGFEIGPLRQINIYFKKHSRCGMLFREVENLEN